MLLFVVTSVDNVGHCALAQPKQLSRKVSARHCALVLDESCLMSSGAHDAPQPETMSGLVLHLR